MFRWFCALTALCLFGCQPARVASDANQPPGATAAAGPDYRAPVAAYIKRYVVNANSLRDVKISQPFPGKANGQTGEVVCVELNAKNRTGKYTGDKRMAFLVQNDTVIDSGYEDPICKDQQLAAWPEMDSGAATAATSAKAKGATHAPVGQ